MRREPESLLTLPEVAEYLRISPSTVWRWCKQGKIPAFQIGRSWRIKQGDLDAVIDRSKHVGLPPVAADAQLAAGAPWAISEAS